MKLQTLYFFLVSLLIFLSAPAQTTEPMLRLNTTMHMETINRIDTDAEGKYVLTCSDDKTAKLWDAGTSDLIQTFRVPIGEGDDGMLYAGAISPDGRRIALSGWTSKKGTDESIYIFDTRSSEMVHRISDLPNVVLDLEYSPSGSYLLASLGGSNGIIVYRTSTYSLYKTDQDYADDSYNVAFDRSGRLATVCYDGYVRLYNANFNLIKKIKPLAGKRPFSLAFSPSGHFLAVGFKDSPNVRVLDGHSLAFLYEPNVSGATSTSDIMDTVCFSEDGSKLIAGGFYSLKKSGKWWQQLRIWTNAGKGSYSDYNGGLNSITDIKPLPNGKIVYSSSQPDWGILHLSTGNQSIFKPSELNDYAAINKSHFKINQDGYEIGITPYSENALIFHLDNRVIREKGSTSPGYQDKSGNIEIRDWRDNTAPKLNSKALSFLNGYEKSWSVDIASDASKIVFGASWNLYGLDTKGKQVWKMPTQASIWCVNISGNNKVVAAGCSDGTVRWYRLSDGAQLLSLYMHPDKQRWVVWTPQGYYDAAPGSEKLIGWHVNQGADRAALFYPASKFRYEYYRPDVIDRVLETLDVEEALKQADEIAQRFGPRTRNIANELPPTVKILSPSTGSTVASNQIVIEYSINSPNGEEIMGIKTLVNGRPVSENRGLKAKGARGSISVAIPSENCIVSIIAQNRFGASEAAAIKLKWEGQISMAADLYKPNLYVLAIGVSEYQNEELKLEFAAKDARDFKNAIFKQNGKLYNSVSTKILTDATASRDNILDGLEWIVRETTQHDVAMIFFAGHGRETSRGTFYYVPVEADLSDGGLRRDGIMREDIKETVATIAGKVVVFMDACHSGKLMSTSRRRGTPDITKIINELIDAENGAVVFSSSIGSQFSLEDPKWGNGAFTKALVEGLNGAAKNSDGSITCKSLDNYITQRVKTLTKGEQATSTNFPPNVQDFPIAVDPN